MRDSTLSFLFAVALFSRYSTGEDIILNVNTAKPISRVSDKFLSLTIDPSTLLNDPDQLTANLERSSSLIKHLAPAYVRLAGATSNEYAFARSASKNPPRSKAIFTDKQWSQLFDWANKSRLDIVMCLAPQTLTNGSEKKSWNPKNALDLISFSDHRGYNLSWQLGYESLTSGVVSGIEMGKYTRRLRNILGTFPRYSNSIIAGPDIVEYKSAQQKRHLQDYFTAVGTALSTITWHPEFASVTLTDDGVSMDYDRLAEDKDELYKVIGRWALKKPLWIAETRAEECKGQFLGALVWAKRLGNAAKLGIPVIMRQPSDLYRATPDYWVSLLHKNLVGREVLDTKIEASHGSYAYFYCHCTKPSAKYEKGSLTIFGVNLTPERVVADLDGINIKTVHKYMLLPGYDSPNRMFSETVLLNNRQLNITDGALPEIEPIISINGRGLKLKLPSGGIGFWVVPDLKLTSCTSSNDEVSNEILGMDEFKHRNKGLTSQITIKEQNQLDKSVDERKLLVTENKSSKQVLLNEEEHHGQSLGKLNDRQDLEALQELKKKLKDYWTEKPLISSESADPLTLVEKRAFVEIGPLYEKFKLKNENAATLEEYRNRLLKLVSGFTTNDQFNFNSGQVLRDSSNKLSEDDLEKALKLLSETENAIKNLEANELTTGTSLPQRKIRYKRKCAADSIESADQKSVSEYRTKDLDKTSYSTITYIEPTGENENDFYGFDQREPLRNFPQGDVFSAVSESIEDWGKENQGHEEIAKKAQQTETIGYDDLDKIQVKVVNDYLNYAPSSNSPVNSQSTNIHARGNLESYNDIREAKLFEGPSIKEASTAPTAPTDEYRVTTDLVNLEDEFLKKIDSPSRMLSSLENQRNERQKRKLFFDNKLNAEMMGPNGIDTINCHNRVIRNNPSNKDDINCQLKRTANEHEDNDRYQKAVDDVTLDNVEVMKESQDSDNAEKSHSNKNKIKLKYKIKKQPSNTKSVGKEESSINATIIDSSNSSDLQMNISVTEAPSPSLTQMPYIYVEKPDFPKPLQDTQHPINVSPDTYQINYNNEQIVEESLIHTVKPKTVFSFLKKRKIDNDTSQIEVEQTTDSTVLFTNQSSNENNNAKLKLQEPTINSSPTEKISTEKSLLRNRSKVDTTTKSSYTANDYITPELLVPPQIDSGVNNTDDQFKSYDEIENSDKFSASRSINKIIDSHSKRLYRTPVIVTDQIQNLDKNQQRLQQLQAEIEKRKQQMSAAYDKILQRYRDRSSKMIEKRRTVTKGDAEQDLTRDQFDNVQTKRIRRSPQNLDNLAQNMDRNQRRQEHFQAEIQEKKLQSSVSSDKLLQRHHRSIVRSESDEDSDESQIDRAEDTRNLSDEFANDTTETSESTEYDSTNENKYIPEIEQVKPVHHVKEKIALPKSQSQNFADSSVIQNSNPGSPVKRTIEIDESCQNNGPNTKEFSIVENGPDNARYLVQETDPRLITQHRGRYVLPVERNRVHRPLQQNEPVYSKIIPVIYNSPLVRYRIPLERLDSRNPKDGVYRYLLNPGEESSLDANRKPVGRQIYAIDPSTYKGGDPVLQLHDDEDLELSSEEIYAKNAPEKILQRIYNSGQKNVLVEYDDELVPIDLERLFNSDNSGNLFEYNPKFDNVRINILPGTNHESKMLDADENSQEEVRRVIVQRPENYYQEKIVLKHPQVPAANARVLNVVNTQRNDFSSREHIEERYQNVQRVPMLKRVNIVNPNLRQQYVNVYRKNANSANLRRPYVYLHNSNRLSGGYNQLQPSQHYNSKYLSNNHQTMKYPIYNKGRIANVESYEDSFASGLSDPKNINSPIYYVVKTKRQNALLNTSNVNNSSNIASSTAEENTNSSDIESENIDTATDEISNENSSVEVQSSYDADEYSPQISANNGRIAKTKKSVKIESYDTENDEESDAVTYQVNPKVDISQLHDINVHVTPEISSPIFENDNEKTHFNSYESDLNTSFDKITENIDSKNMKLHEVKSDDTFNEPVTTEYPVPTVQTQKYSSKLKINRINTGELRTLHTANRTPYIAQRETQKHNTKINSNIPVQSITDDAENLQPNLYSKKDVNHYDDVVVHKSNNHRYPMEVVNVRARRSIIEPQTNVNTNPNFIVSSVEYESPNDINFNLLENNISKEKKLFKYSHRMKKQNDPYKSRDRNSKLITSNNSFFIVRA